MRGIWTRRGTWIAAALMMTCTASISRAGDRATTAPQAQKTADHTGRKTRERDGTKLPAKFGKQSSRTIRCRLARTT